MLTVHLAAWAQGQGMHAVVIDTDPQGSVGKWRERSQAAGVAFPEVLVLRPSIFREDWPALKKRYEAIVIDTPPHVSELVHDYAKEMSAIVVPVTPSGPDLDALGTTLAALPQTRTRLVLNRANDRAATRDVRELLLQRSLPLSVVHDYAAFGTATLRGGTVLGRYPNGSASEDVRTLAREVFS